MDITEQPLNLEVSGTRMKAALTLPAERTAPRWGIILVPGSFFNDLEGDYSYADGNPFELRPHTYGDLARQFAGLGHAVLRYAKAGKEVVEPAAAEATRTFAGQAFAVGSAAGEIRRRIPGIRLAIAGHSEGAAVSLAWLSRVEKPAADAFVSLSGPGMRFFDVMISQAAAQAQNGLVSFGGYSYPFALYLRSFDFVRAGRPVPADIASALPPFGVHAMPPGARQYLVDYDNFDSAAAIGSLPLPVLIVQGGRDTSVAPDNAERLRAARQGNKCGTDKAFFEDLNHFYKRVPREAPSEAVFGLTGETDVRVAESVSIWLKSL